MPPNMLAVLIDYRTGHTPILQHIAEKFFYSPHVNMASITSAKSVAQVSTAVPELILGLL